MGGVWEKGVTATSSHPSRQVADGVDGCLSTSGFGISMTASTASNISPVLSQKVSGERCKLD